jgi:uncharacterized membrane protein
MPTFTISEALRFGYHSAKEWFFPLLPVLLVIFMLQTIVAISVDENTFLQVVAQLFVIPGFTLASLSVFFRVLGGHRPEFAHLTERFDRYINFLGTNILYLLTILAGVLLFVVPGVYAAIRLMFAHTIVADKGVDPMTALKSSWAITEGHFWRLLGLNICLGALNLCGALLLGIGLLFTVPLSSFALLLVYKKLMTEPQTPPLLPVPKERVKRDIS